MVLDKELIQKEVEATIKGMKYTEGLGRVILLFADVTVHKRGLNYRFSEFDVEFIIKPKIVDMLLLKVYRYNPDFASAYTFFNLITSAAILDAIQDIRRALKGDSLGVFYIEDVLKEVRSIRNGDNFHFSDSVYLEGEVIKLR